MFVTSKRHRELENHYDRLADYAARINLENSRLKAEVEKLERLRSQLGDEAQALHESHLAARAETRAIKARLRAILGGSES